MQGNSVSKQKSSVYLTLNACFIASNALLAKSFVEGWDGADVTCQIPILAMKVLNSLLVKEHPLSETNVCGSS